MKRADAFTLIELMIVVAIIGILAAIAVPSMLHSRIQANETNAIGNLRAYASAQTIWRNGNYSLTGNSAGNQFRKGYCDVFQKLYSHDLNGEPAKLIPEEFANAVPGTPTFGYWYHNPLHQDPQSMDIFRLYAVAMRYGTTGINTYYIGVEAVVKAKDFGAQMDPGGRAALDPMNPDDPAEGWFIP